MEEKDINELTEQEETLSGNVENDDPIESEELIEEEPADEDPAVEDESEEAPAKPDAPKKKKKLAKWKIALICVAAFILFLGLAAGIFFLVGALNSHERESLDLEFHNTKPAYAVSYTATELNLIKKAMKDDADEDTVKKAIAMIYAKANNNKINNSPSAVAVLRGEGSATLDFGAQKPSGTMIVRGIKAQSGNEFYYQKGAAIIKCSIPPLQSTLEDVLNQQERLYSNGVDDFRATYNSETGLTTLKGADALISTDKVIELEYIPFLKMSVPAKTKYKTYTKKKLYEKAYYLDDPREITNFKITEDTIVLKELKEGEKYIELNEEEGYYTCRFSLLVEGEGHDECVQNSRQYLRDSAGSDNLEYGKFDVTLEVWENGWLKRMRDEEIWQGTVSVPVLGSSTTSSDTWYESIIFYDYNEELFSAEDAEKFEGEDWVQKLIAAYKEQIDNAPRK